MPHWCHGCKSQVEPKALEDGEIQCPLCDSFFVEEIDESSSSSQSQGPRNGNEEKVTGETSTQSSQSSDSKTNSSPEFQTLRFPFMDNDSKAVTATWGMRQFSGRIGGNDIQFQFYQGSTPLQQIFSEFDRVSPLSFMNIASSSFAQAESHDIQDILNHIMMNDNNRYGTPPASKDAVKKLNEYKLTESHLEKMGKEACSVCKDEFKVGDTVCELPCGHIYHLECIHPWLKLHNSCPTCRYELPTDDEVYERRKRQRISGPTRN